jgi:cell division protein ZapA (FtsZ GTPase activity inhibitor)
MNTLTKKYKISIFGELYSFIGDEENEMVISAAHVVDTMMRDIAEKTHTADPKRIAVLAALQLATCIQDMEQQLGQYKEIHDTIFERLDRLERESTFLS